MKPRSFVRKVGFGLRPEEKIPKDPLNWAKSQMTFAPKLIWPGKIYSEKEFSRKPGAINCGIFNVHNGQNEGQFSMNSSRN